MKKRKYFTEEERLEAKRESARRWQKKKYQENPEKYREIAKVYRKNNPEKVRENGKRWREKHPEYDADYGATYRKTPKGRAVYLLKGYKREDKKNDRGECTLTADWIVQHILSQPCHYCDKSDWSKLGCDRIDNNLPHTPENVVPCCCDCNKKKARYEYDEYMRMIGKIKSGGSPTS